MEKLQITGHVHKVFETQQISGTFSKREFILELEKHSDYPQLVKFELTQNNCAKADNISEGQEITVFFNLRGRSWVNKEGETKYFSSIQAWRIEAAAAIAPPVTGKMPAESIDSDELPF